MTELFRKKNGRFCRMLLTIGMSGLCGVGMFAFKYKQIINSNNNPSDVHSVNTLFLLRGIFGRTRSRITGALFNKEIPPFARECVYKSVAKIFDINLDEIRYPLKSYRCFGHLFARTLKDKSRVIKDVSPHSIVSPCDSEVLSYGEVLSDRIPQIKNATYNLNAFLGTEAYKHSNKGKNLKYIVLYLSPNSYHHFHSPCDFKLLCRRHFAGEALPVKKFFLAKFNDIFSVNERVVLSGRWLDGMLHMAMVAAYNVGNIRLAFEPKLKTNQLRCQLTYVGGDINVKSYIDEKLDLSIGQHLGEFRLGSTIVLVFEANENFKWNVEVGKKVKVGESLGGVHAPQLPEKTKYAFYAFD